MMNRAYLIMIGDDPQSVAFDAEVAEAEATRIECEAVAEGKSNVNVAFLSVPVIGQASPAVREFYVRYGGFGRSGVVCLCHDCNFSWEAKGCGLIVGPMKAESSVHCDGCGTKITPREERHGGETP